MRVERHATQPPPRYTEAGLVRRLDELGIGRPSTWVAIVAVLQERGYAILHDRRFVPTERGRVATAFLEAFFGGWVETGFTAAMEEDLDRIAGGAIAWRGMLEGFWGGFHAALEAAGALERATVLTAIEQRLDGFLFGAGSGRRRCPACPDGRLELRLSRYGPFVGCADYPACGYRRGLAAAGAEDGYTGPRDLGIDPASGLPGHAAARPERLVRPARRAEQTLGAGKSRSGCRCRARRRPGSVDLDVARRLLALPREVGRHPESGQQILAGIGRYGPWLRHEETYAAIPADEDVLAIGLNRAVDLIADKQVRESRARGPKQVLRKLGPHPDDGAPVWLKTGHYGPFVAHRRRYASLPEDVPEDDADPGAGGGTPGPVAVQDRGRCRGRDGGRRPGPLRWVHVMRRVPTHEGAGPGNDLPGASRADHRAERFFPVSMCASRRAWQSASLASVRSFTSRRKRRCSATSAWVSTTAFAGMPRFAVLPPARREMTQPGPWPGAPSAAQRHPGLPHLR